jgi:hypothetical protein
MSRAMLPAMSRDGTTRRVTPPRGAGPAVEPVRLVESFFATPWSEIEQALRALLRLHEVEVAAWHAWHELRLALLRVERVAFDPGFKPESLRKDGGAALRAAAERAFAEVATGMHRRPRPSGHPGLHNRRYLQDWIAEFPPDRLLNWRGDDLPYGLRRLRDQLGDELTDRLLDQTDSASTALHPPPEKRMSGDEHLLPWLVLVIEVGALHLASQQKRAPSRVVAAIYSLLTGDKTGLALVARRVDEERRRYRKGQKAHVVRGGPRWPKRTSAT